MMKLPDVPPGYEWRKTRFDNKYVLRSPICGLTFPQSVSQYPNVYIWVWDTDGKSVVTKPLATCDIVEQVYEYLAARAWAGLPIGGEPYENRN